MRCVCVLKKINHNQTKAMVKQIKRFKSTALLDQLKSDCRPHQQKSTMRLTAETIFYGALSNPMVQKNIPKLTNYILKNKPPILTHMMDLTCSRMFLGGETLKQAKPLLQHLNHHNIKTIIDLANEGENTNPKKTFDAIIKLIQDAGHYPEITGIAIKISGLTDHKTLREWHNNTPQLEINKTELLAKVDALAQLAKNNNRSLYIDAENHMIQSAINDITRSVMKKFNVNRTPTIFTTHQTYLKASLKMLEEDIAWAKKHNVCFATKLVRGAYYEETLALEPNNPLVFETKNSTDAAFNHAVKRCAEENIHVLVATHNSESLALLDNLKHNHSLSSTQTAQLLGMRDDLTFKKSAHFPSKYVPIGQPNHGAREYFGRRIIENSSALSGATIEVRTRLVELTKRINNVFNINLEKN